MKPGTVKLSPSVLHEYFLLSVFRYQYFPEFEASNFARFGIWRLVVKGFLVFFLVIGLIDI
jgi:hypothetical protein